MIKGGLLLCFYILSLFAMQLDIATLQDIVKNDPQAYNERLILAKYYEKRGNDLQAEFLVDEALKIKPKDKSALQLKSFLKRKELIKAIFKNADLAMPIDPIEAQAKLQTYYETNNYQLYSDLYQALIDSGVTLDDTLHIEAANIYFSNDRYAQAEKALSYVQEKNNIDKEKIEADICYIQGKYRCAIPLYEKLYNSSYKLDYAIKLINSYILTSQYEKAQRFYTFLIRRYPDSKELQQLGEKLQKVQQQYALKTKESYETNPNYTTLESYVALLNRAGKKEEVLKVLKEYNQKNPSAKSLLLEAKYLTWYDHSHEALEVLRSQSLKSDYAAKLLLGKIYSWEQKFLEAKEYLDEVAKYANDTELIFEAKKALAYIDMWEEHNKRAKKEFSELLKEKPADKEIQEALMELNHDYGSLIKIYKKRVADFHDSADVKRLAELYIGNKEQNKAIAYLKRYLKKNPEDLEAMKNLAILLIDKKEFYKGFGYLEYYAAQKNDVESKILLAKYYYWNGFSKEALDVLNKALEAFPQNREALELKAKILKLSPRFTLSRNRETIGMYYNKLGKTQLSLADTLYFNSHYEASLMYYENYLKNHPNDNKARLRYAYALEYSKWYGKAEGEFALLENMDDDNNVKYHYALNLMKNGKYEAAKKEFLALKNEVYKKVSPQLEKFLQEWKSDWESQDFTKYVRHYSQKYSANRAWVSRKKRLFSTLKYIRVNIKDPLYKELGTEHYKVKFFQEYVTNKKSDEGYKTLELICKDGQQECTIVDEKWRAGKYNKEGSIEVYVDNALAELERLEKNPPLLSMKKHSIYETQQNNIVLLDKDHNIYLLESLNNKPKNIFAASSSNQAAKKVVTRNALLANVYYFEDSAGIIFKTTDLFYKREKLSDDFAIGVDGGVVSLEQKGQRIEKGKRYGISLFYKNFSFRLGQNLFDDFSEFVPTIKYQNRYKEHSYLLEYTRQNALFYTYAFCPYDEEVSVDHFSISDYISFTESRNLWANLILNRYSNSDLETIMQFDWRFYYSWIFEKNFTYDLAMEGYYLANSQVNSCFYSPSFNDATLLRVDPNYRFNKYMSAKGMFGAGYSFESQKLLYKYGMWLYGDFYKNFSYNVGCMQSNSSQKNFNGSGYYYKECKLDLGYKW